MPFAETVLLGSVRIRVISAPYFIATKYAAFVARGKGDYMGSHDLEDLVAIVDGRPNLVQDVATGDASIRVHLSGLVTGLLADTTFLDALPGHLADPGRAEVVLGRLRAIAATA